MRLMVALAAVFSLFSPRFALAQPPAAAAANQPRGGLELSASARLSGLQDARDALAAGLLNAAASGTIKQIETRNGAVSIREHDLRIVTSGEKYSVQLVEKVPSELLGESDPDATVATNVTPRKPPLTSHFVLFDGDSVYSMEASEQACQGKALFGFQQKAALRGAGYPLCPPLHLWSAFALPTSSANVQLQTLGGAAEEADENVPSSAPTSDRAGTKRISNDQASDMSRHGQSAFVLHEKNAGFSVKYYFFGEFDYDLRRIAFISPASTRPFREVAYEWGKVADDFYYPSRFVVRDRNLPSEPSDTRIDVNDLIIEFHDVQLGPEAVAGLQFTLSDLPIPLGTTFDDHRENENGKPVKKIWDGSVLRRP